MSIHLCLVVYLLNTLRNHMMMNIIYNVPQKGKQMSISVTFLCLPLLFFSLLEKNPGSKRVAK